MEFVGYLKVGQEFAHIAFGNYSSKGLWNSYLLDQGDSKMLKTLIRDVFVCQRVTLS